SPVPSSSSSWGLPANASSTLPPAATNRSVNKLGRVPIAMDADWRTQLQPAARSRIVNKITQTLIKHLPISPPPPDGLIELQRIAVRFEDRMYAAATSQSDYLRKIALKMLSLESQTKTEHNSQVIPAGSSSKVKKGKKLRCHFCKKAGHFKKDCLKKKKWFEKKGIAYDPTHKRT
ncbi:unnamed protein product, partial [Urochloa humidicola]